MQNSWGKLWGDNGLALLASGGLSTNLHKYDPSRGMFGHPKPIDPMLLASFPGEVYFLGKSQQESQASATQTFDVILACIFVLTSIWAGVAIFKPPQ